MQVDITNENYPNPALPQMHNIHADWKEWFKFADAVTLKNVLLNRDVYREALRTARRYNLPTYIIDSRDYIMGKNRTRIIDLHLKPLRADGNSGYVLYESFMFMRAKPNGTFDLRVPEIGEIVAPFFKNGGNYG